MKTTFFLENYRQQVVDSVECVLYSKKNSNKAAFI